MLEALSWKRAALPVAAGITIGLMLAMVGGAGTTNPSDDARYQLHVWYHAGSSPGDVGKHGAYRIDTQTGEVWSINLRDEAHKIEFK